METETTTGTAKLNESLAKAQAEMAVAEMTGYNPHFKSKFSTLADLVKAARPSLSKYGLSVTQSLDFVDDKYWVLATLRHTSGEFIGSRLQLIIGSKQDMQTLGSAITYGQRYQYRCITGVIFLEDDDGNDAVSTVRDDRPSKAAFKLEEPTNGLTDKQQRYFRKLVNDRNIQWSDVIEFSKKTFNIADVKLWTSNEFNAWLQFIGEK